MKKKIESKNVCKNEKKKKNRYSQAHNLKGSAPSHTHTNTCKQSSAPLASAPNNFACSPSKTAPLTNTQADTYIDKDV